MDSKPYDKPELSRFGDFRDLTRGDPAGKTVGGADLHPVHHSNEVCNPNPGIAGCIS